MAPLWSWSHAPRLTYGRRRQSSLYNINEANAKRTVHGRSLSDTEETMATPHPALEAAVAQFARHTLRCRRYKP